MVSELQIYGDFTTVIPERYNRLHFTDYYDAPLN